MKMYKILVCLAGFTIGLQINCAEQEGALFFPDDLTSQQDVSIEIYAGDTADNAITGQQVAPLATIMLPAIAKDDLSNLPTYAFPGAGAYKLMIGRTSGAPTGIVPITIQNNEDSIFVSDIGAVVKTVAQIEAEADAPTE